VFGPVESTQGVGSSGREKGVGSEGSARKVFHQFCHGQGKMIVRFEPRDGESGEKGLSEFVAAHNTEGNLGVRLCKKKKRARLIGLGPEDIGQKQRCAGGGGESGCQGWKILQELNLGGGEKVAEQCS